MLSLLFDELVRESLPAATGRTRRWRRSVRPYPHARRGWFEVGTLTKDKHKSVTLLTHANSNVWTELRTDL